MQIIIMGGTGCVSVPVRLSTQCLSSMFCICKKDWGCLSVFAGGQATYKPLLQNMQRWCCAYLVHTLECTPSNKRFCHVGPYMNDLSQKSVQTKALDSIKHNTHISQLVSLASSCKSI